MNLEPATVRLALLTPETLAELEELVRQRLGRRLREFRLSIRDAGLVLGGRTRSHHAKQLAQHALMDMTRAPITANEIEVRDFPRPAPFDRFLEPRWVQAATRGIFHSEDSDPAPAP
jgi:hypothetical protein